MTFKFLYTLTYVQEMIVELLYICNTTKAQSSFSSEKTSPKDHLKYKTSAASLQQPIKVSTSKVR